MATAQRSGSSNTQPGPAESGTDIGRQQTPTLIPVFSIRLPDSTVFQSSSLPAHVPVLLAYIDPTCSHCIQEALNIRAAMDSNKLGNLQVVLVAAKTDGMAGLLPSLELEKHPALHIGVDDNYKLYDRYKVREVPLNIWYDSTGKVVHYSLRDFDIEKLKAWVKHGST